MSEPASLTTAVAAGGYRLQLEHADELGLVQASVRLFERVPACRLDPRGYLWLTTDEAVAERQRDLVERQLSWGVDGVELWSGDAARARFPWVSPDVIQARFRAGDGLLDPVGLTHGLLAGSGAEVVTDCRVTGFTVAGSQLRGVETTRGPIACETAVIACGPLSGTIAALAGVVLPVTAVRRHRVSLRDVPEVPRDAPMTIDEDTAAHWRPAPLGAIALLPELDEPASAAVQRVAVDAGFADRLLDPSSSTALARVAPFWRDVWRGGRARWTVEAGQYTMTPDQRPLIGETAVTGLWVNTGYSGHGVMAGPGGSELLAGMLEGESSAEQALFSLDRTFGSTSQRW